MEQELAEKWMQKLGIADDKLQKQTRKMTRGEFLQVV